MDKSLSIEKVLISDDIDDVCVQLLMLNKIEVEVDTKLSKDQLKEKIKDFDALIVRSATKVTKDIITSGQRLKLIGRAGTGVDNIDLDAATEAGIVVMNTPTGNSRSAAELTCAMIMCLARRVPQADSSMKQEKWERKIFMGNEVYGKTLAILGLGRIGREVATRMKAFGMEIIGYDPIINADESKKFDVEWLPLEKIWDQADYITVHVPLMPQTENLINAATLEKCKKSVYIINCARGGIVNESDLLEALNSGYCRGAAFDVYVDEPPKNYSLMKHKNTVCSPHIGASTVEAQFRVAQEIAEQIVAFNSGKQLLGAVNGRVLAPAFIPGVKEVLNAVVDGSYLLNSLLNKQSAPAFSVTVPMAIHKSAEASIIAAFHIGYYKTMSNAKINYINCKVSVQGTGPKITVNVIPTDQDAVIISAETDKKIQYSVAVFHSGLGTNLLSINGIHFGQPVLLSGSLAFYSFEKDKILNALKDLAAKTVFVCRQREAGSEGKIYTIASLDENLNSGGDEMLKPICSLKFN